MDPGVEMKPVVGGGGGDPGDCSTDAGSIDGGGTLDTDADDTTTIKHS